LEAFATELIDITLRLREGILAVLTASTEEEMKAASLCAKIGETTLSKKLV
jgi:hypothetical protein